MIRKDNGSNNSLFLSCQMGLSDGTFFMIKHTPLPNGNHPISSPVCPMGVADTLEQYYVFSIGDRNSLFFPFFYRLIQKFQVEVVDFKVKKSLRKIEGKQKSFTKQFH